MGGALRWLFYFLSFDLAVFNYVDQAGPELILTCLCLPGARTKGLRYSAWLSLPQLCIILIKWVLQYWFVFWDELVSHPWQVLGVWCYSAFHGKPGLKGGLPSIVATFS